MLVQEYIDDVKEQDIKTKWKDSSIRLELRTHIDCDTSLKGLVANGKNSVNPKW